MRASIKNGVWGRAVGILICLAVIAKGTFSLYKSGWVYSNYWGGLVFAPIGILVGLLFIYVIIFRWDTLNKPMVDKKGRRIRFPGDDFRKW